MVKQQTITKETIEPTITPTPTPTEDTDLLRNLMSKVEQLQKDNEMLKWAADKSRLQRWEESHRVGKPKVVMLTIEGDKVAIAWRTIKDEVELNSATGAYTENQEYEILFDDNSKKIIKRYPEFVRWQYSSKVAAEVLSETHEQDGSRTFKVQLPDGKNLVVGDRFVN